MSEPTNAARELAATGTPEPWSAEVFPAETVDGVPWPAFAEVEPSVASGADPTDALKITRLVNALGPLGDLLDALVWHRPKPSLFSDSEVCYLCGYNWPCPIATARDAVEAALRGEQP